LTNFWLLSQVSTEVFLLLPPQLLWQELLSFIFESTSSRSALPRDGENCQFWAGGFGEN